MIGHKIKTGTALIFNFQRLHIVTDFGIGHTGVMLCRADVFMAEHLADGFDWYIFSEGNNGSEGAPRQMLDVTEAAGPPEIRHTKNSCGILTGKWDKKG